MHRPEAASGALMKPIAPQLITDATVPGKQKD